jgi:hypothetical protein
MGQVNWPPLICRTLAALFRIWSNATALKFHVMNSTTGRSPTIAAPTPMPANPASAIGVSMTRLTPNFSSIPSLTL